MLPIRIKNEDTVRRARVSVLSHDDGTGDNLSKYKVEADSELGPGEEQVFFVHSMRDLKVEEIG